MTPLAMKRKAPKPHTQAPASAALQRQRGLTLLESLAALVVLALGILGLLAAQTRMLVETRTTNSRATAIRQIVDLGERIKLNRAAALADNYNVEILEAAPSTAPAVCNKTESSAAEVAQCDTWQWRNSLKSALPEGRGSITRTSTATYSNQLRVVVAWKLNEKAGEASTSGGAAPLHSSLTLKDEAGNLICPNGYICHIQYLEI